MDERSDLPRLPSLVAPSQETLNDPASLFLHLTSWTVPHGGEARYYGEVLAASGFVADDIGNWWRRIPMADGSSSATCFMAHLDTCGDGAVPVTRLVDSGVCRTDGRTILGADDRAGVTVLLHLATRGVPGLYYLFAGEEVGCVGSAACAERGYLTEHCGNKIDRCISFDRKGTTSVVTHQCGRRTCSRDFAQALANDLNAYGLAYAPDDTGVFTDSREFAAAVPECTNISVGYYDMHSHKERQDLNFLAYLCDVLVGVNWEDLPTERVPGPDGDYDGAEWGPGPVVGLDDWGWSEDDCSFGAFSASIALDAVDELIENLLEDVPCDPATIHRMVMGDRFDTVEMIELLLNDLQRKLRQRKGYK